MASLTGKLGQVNSAVVLIEASYPLTALNDAMKKAIAKDIKPKQGYLSKFEVVDELRLRLHADYRSKVPVESLQAAFDAAKNLLDPTVPMTEIVKTTGSFEAVQTYIETLATEHTNIFSPPLAGPFKTELHDAVYSIPTINKNDVRRYGRVLMFDKFEKDVFEWLINNSPLFGFLLYEDYGLFYLGVAPIQALVNKSGLESVLGKFQRTPINTSLLTITPSTLASAQQPVPPPPPAPPAPPVPAGIGFTPVPSSVTPTSGEYIIVEGGHGAYWPGKNPFSKVNDYKIGAGAGDDFHSFGSTVEAHPGRTMDLQIEKGLRDFKQKYNKPADIVGMTVTMNHKASSKQVQWKALIQESKDGVHRAYFTGNGSAKDPGTSLSSTISQIDAKKGYPNFKKVYFFQYDMGSLLITQIFALSNKKGSIGEIQ